MTKAIIILDAKTLNEVFFETIYVDNGFFNIYYNNDDSFLFLDRINNKVISYTYNNNTYEKVVFDEYDLSNHEFKKITDISYNNSNYKIENNGNDIIITDIRNYHFEKTLFDLFKDSKVGKDIYNYSIEIDRELKGISNSDYYEIFTNKNELYIIYKFRAGFLFNKNLLGELETLAFKFDFETMSLKYIGKTPSYIKTIYFEE